MRFLACFSRSNTAMDSPTRKRRDKQDQSSSFLTSPANSATNKNNRTSNATYSDPFYPKSIPELHPEYAHAEPYCFAARTNSTRLVVEKQRCARGQPVRDRAEILSQQGVIVVRGPEYNSQRVNQNVDSPPPTQSPPQPMRPVSLKVETATTEDTTYVDSSDEPSSSHDENVDLNASSRSLRARLSPRSHNRKSSVSNTATSLSSTKSRSRRRNANPAPKSRSPFRIRSKSSKSIKNSKFNQSPPIRRANSSNLSISISDAVVTETDTMPPVDTNSSNFSPPPSDFDADSDRIEEHVRPHLDNTPKELLAPIRVPRMSSNFPPKSSMSPVVSNDSWGAQDSTVRRRFEDVECEDSSDHIRVPLVGNQSIVHKANYPSRAPEFPPSLRVSPLQSYAPTESNTLRSRRKSKPYDLSATPLSFDDTSAPAPLLDFGTLPQDIPEDEASIPSLSRISRSFLSNDPAPTMDLRGSSSTMYKARKPDKVEDDLPPARLDAKTQSQGMMRRVSSGKRKTVSFHNAAPTIIEPNLRAPSYSVPRNTLLSKEEIQVHSEVPARIHPALQHARDSVKLASSSLPRSFESHRSLEDRVPSPAPGARDRLTPSRPAAAPVAEVRRFPTQPTTSQTSISSSQLSDFSGASDENMAHGSRRMSGCVVKDRVELREASKRQSKAVAQAMACQIRGVPKSAMLAYSENVVVLADSFVEDDDSSRLSFKRKSRQIKSVRMPEFVPGVIPKPPPPPPFGPARTSVKSVRAAPIPPPPRLAN